MAAKPLYVASDPRLRGAAIQWIALHFFFGTLPPPMLKKSSRHSLSLFSIFFTVFLDLLGVGIVAPVIAVVLLRDDGGMLPMATSYQFKTIILGLLMAAYPLAQFVGAPILGAISDRVGRRKVLLFVLAGSGIGYCMFGLGIRWNSLLLLFFSRIIDGFGGGSLAVAVSAIADISTEHEKARNFGFVGTAIGLGFILGPFIGGQLSDPTALSWFTYSTPFWFAAVLCFINVLLVYYWLPETLKTFMNTPISVWSGVQNIHRALQLRNLRTIFIVVFGLTFGFSFFTQFFQVFLIDKFQFNQKQIGDLFAYIGFWIVITQAILVGRFSKRLSPASILSLSSLGLAISLPFLVIPESAVALLFILPLIAIFQGLIQPSCITIVSNLATKESQGEMMGIYQSIQSIGIAIPPIIAGVIVSVHMTMPTLVAAACTLASWLIFVIFFRKEHRELFGAKTEYVDPGTVGLGGLDGHG